MGTSQEERSIAILSGIDEAGRGALAGPVSAAAVILGEKFPHALTLRLADSKQLTADQRTALEPLIMRHAASWAVAFASPSEIDRLNILGATLSAMERAFNLLFDATLLSYPFSIARGGSARVAKQSITAIIDGPHAPPLNCDCRPLIGADGSVREVQAASILAKTARDRWMVNYATIDGRYGFERHKGYPTRAHRRQLAVHGRSTIHRKSFSWRPA